MTVRSRRIRPWMVGLIVCCQLPILVPGGRHLLQRWRAEQQELTISIATADGLPVEGIRVAIRCSQRTIDLDEIARQTNGDLNASVSSTSPQLLDLDDVSQNWFIHGPIQLMLTTSSHGTLETTIDSHDVNLTLAAPAFASITLEPPLTPSRTHTYELWVTATERQHPDVRLDLRPRDGDPNTPIRFGPVQPGRFRLTVHRVPRETPGAQFHGWGTSGNSERERFVDLVSGGNELR